MAGSQGVAKKIFKQPRHVGVPNGNANKTADRLLNLQGKYDQPAQVENRIWNGPNGETLGGNNAPFNRNRRFPITVGQPNEHDKMFDIKQQYGKGELRDPEGNKINPGDLGMAVFDESDKAYLAEKEKQRLETEYESFAASVFNLDDPATAALVGEKILPDFYKKREAEIEKQAELQTRLAMIRLRGYPKDAKELSLVFALRKGLISLPRGAVWDPKTWSTSEPNLARGFFNPLRYTRGAAPYSNVDDIFTGPGNVGNNYIGSAWPEVGRTKYRA